MFFFYHGQAPIDVLPPGEQYTTTISPSPKSQKATDERLYHWLFDEAFEHRALFVKTADFADVPGPMPVEAKAAEDLAKPAKRKAEQDKGDVE